MGPVSSPLHEAMHAYTRVLRMWMILARSVDYGILTEPARLPMCWRLGQHGIDGVIDGSIATRSLAVAVIQIAGCIGWTFEAAQREELSDCDSSGKAPDFVHVGALR